MARYFNAIEAMCKDGTYVPPALLGNFEKVAGQADVIRGELGAPLFVVSGYRTPDYNKGRGRPGSRHLTAEALDLRPRTVARWGMLNRDEQFTRVHGLYVLTLRLLAGGRLPLIGGLGYYPGKWIHIDVREKKANGGLAWFASAKASHLDDLEHVPVA